MWNFQYAFYNLIQWNKSKQLQLLRIELENPYPGCEKYLKIYNLSSIETNWIQQDSSRQNLWIKKINVAAATSDSQ